MSGNYFWIFVVLAIAGLLLTLFGGKKQQGAKDFPPSVQWGALFVVIGVFGVLSEYISLTAVLLLFVLLTGLITALDKWLLAKRRTAESKEANLVVDYARGFFPVILVVFLLRTFLVEPFTIPSSSMRPGLIVGDFILVNKFIYGLRVPVLNNVLIPVGHIERGDVVVFNNPMNTKVNFIKRVIGLPGDTIEYRNKRLTVNGQALPDVKDGTYDYLEQGVATIHNDRYRESFPNGKQAEILNIPDMPTYAPSQVLDFPGREQCRYDDDGFVCKVPAGKYFMMGDNRDNSLDSRYWGFVDDQLVVGRAFLIWMNFSQLSRIGQRIG